MTLHQNGEILKREHQLRRKSRIFRMKIYRNKEQGTSDEVGQRYSLQK